MHVGLIQNHINDCIRNYGTIGSIGPNAHIWSHMRRFVIISMPTLIIISMPTRTPGPPASWPAGWLAGTSWPAGQPAAAGPQQPAGLQTGRLASTGQPAGQLAGQPGDQLASQLA